eukprot:1159774-Pelagomonas_calceolata.AAC.3
MPWAGDGVRAGCPRCCGLAAEGRIRKAASLQEAEERMGCRKRHGGGTRSIREKGREQIGMPAMDG